MATFAKSSTTPSRYETLDSFRTTLPLNNSKTTLKTLYRTKPITMHRTYPSKQGMRWPKVIRDAYAAIWSGKHSRIIIKAPRGGGKSKLLGTVGFDKWFLQTQNVVNMGGSKVQADIVYSYFSDLCDAHASIYEEIENGERGLKASETCGTQGNKFSCVTASPKQVRGKHPDVLLSDETCETSDELIDAALPMVNDSQNPLIVMASTFHKIFGRFAETWDNAEERGYLRIEWDIFDVAAVFPADYWENGITKDGKLVRNIDGIEKLKAMAKGRTGDPDGWIRIESVVQAWREKPSDSWFEVEYMGTRPSTAGLVLNPQDVDRARFDSDHDLTYTYVQGATCVLGIDWGFSTMTAVAEGMLHRDDVVVLLDNQNYHQEAAEVIIKDVIAKVKLHGIRFIYADSAGKFENKALQDALVREKLPCKVVEVVFSKEKESMLGNLRAHFERNKFRLPQRFVDAYYQLKNYRYIEGTDKVVKKDDHIPDAIQCILQHYRLGETAHRLITQGSPRGAAHSPITRGIMRKKF